MKKLIAMIGAVATAFGLYAAEPTLATTFETGDAGVNGTTLTLGTGDEASGWTGLAEETLELGTYSNDAYTYGTPPSANTRRETFDAKGDNAQFLKLETGTNTISHAIGAKVIDQLVKFTGFEEAQTNFVEGTKIAVWMSAIETEGTAQIGTPAQGVEGDDGYVPASSDYQPASDDYHAGETNLYVTVGDGAKAIKVQVDPASIDLTEFKPETWYRLTIKSIGNVIADNKGVEYTQDGFLIYIDGKQVAMVEEPTWHINSSAFKASAAKSYADKQLFTAIAKGTAETIATLGFTGIGAADDIFADDDGPEFCQSVAITEEALNEFFPGAKAVEVTQNGEVIPLEAGVYTIKPGNKIVVTYGPNGPYVVTPKNAYATYNVALDGTLTKIDDESEIDVVEAAVQVVDANNETNFYAEAELNVELIGLKTGDTATVLKDCAITQGEEEAMVTLFSFTKNTTIEVPEANVWNVFIANVDEQIAGMLTDNVGLFAGKTVNVTFGEKIADDNVCVLSIFGAIAGDITAADNGLVYIDADGVGGSTLAGTIRAANVVVNGAVTLGENGKLITTDNTIDCIFDGEGKQVEAVEGPEAGWYTYQIISTVKFTLVAPANATVTKVEGEDGEIKPDEDGYYAADPEAELTVTLTANDGYLFADGKTTATEKIMAVAGSIPLETTAPAKAGFAIIIAGEPTTTNYYPTLDAAIAAAGTGDPALPTTVTLLADCELTQCCVISKTVTLDIGEFDVTASQADGVLQGDGYGGKRFVNGTPRTTLFVVEHGANLTVLGTTGTIDASTAQVGAAITMTKSGDDATKGDAVLTVNANLSGYYYAIAGNGTRPGSAITINCGTIQGTSENNSAGIYAPQAGTIVINGGTITGATGIYAKSGSLTVNGGTIAAIGATATPTYNGNGFESTGDAIILDGAGEKYAGDMTLVLGKDATLTSASSYGVREVVTKGESQTLAITDNGAAITAPLGGLNVSDDFLAKVEAGTVTISGYVADVNGLCYKTLADAVAAANANDTVTLLANVTLTATLNITKAITLDLNKKTVTGDWDAGLNGVAGSRVYMFECGANAVTFENGTIASKANNIGALHTQGGELTVNAIVNTKWRAIGAYDGAKVVVGANAVLTTAGEDPTIFIWSNFANRGDTTVQCDVTIAGKVYNTFNGTRTSANLDAVIMGSGNDQGAGVKLTVADDAEISGTACAGIYFPCAGLLEIGAASITGTEGVYVKGGASTVVNGAVITATGTANAFVADHNGHAWTGDAFVVDVSKGYAAVETQSISGGTFTSDNGAAVASYKEAGATADRVTGFITGGTFSSNPGDCVAAGYKAVGGPDTWTVAAKEFYDITFKVEGQADYVTNVVEDTELSTVVPADPKRDGFKFTGWDPEVTGVAESNATYTAQFEAVETDITITVNFDENITSVKVDGQEIESGNVKLKADTKKVTITLAADSLTIPVFKNGDAVVAKSAEYDVADGATFTFTAEEAEEAEVTEEQTKQAILDAIDEGESHEAAVAKVNAIVTTETTPAVGKVTASELAAYIKENSISSKQLAASEYVAASVKLGTDVLINESTEVEVATVEKTTSDLAVTIKIGDKDATKEQIMSFVEVCDDLGAANDWEKLPTSTLQSAVQISAGKLVITPVTGIDKMFLKVSIPKDPVAAK